MTSRICLDWDTIRRHKLGGPGDGDRFRGVVGYRLSDGIKWVGAGLKVSFIGQTQGPGRKNPLAVGEDVRLL